MSDILGLVKRLRDRANSMEPNIDAKLHREAASALLELVEVPETHKREIVEINLFEQSKLPKYTSNEAGFDDYSIDFSAISNINLKIIAAALLVATQFPLDIQSKLNNLGFKGEIGVKEATRIGQIRDIFLDKSLDPELQEIKGGND